MNNIEKIHPINKNNLNPQHYFQSLIQEAHRLTLLSDKQLENIQLQCAKLLTKQVQRYNSGDSSSVRVEIAQSIFEGTLYTIGIYLKSLSDLDIALTEINQIPLEELYKKGRKLVGIKINMARHLLNRVQHNAIETDNMAYNDTLKNGLPAFFPAYDADFATHDTSCSIDYPLCVDKMETVGIEYIYGYLEKLYWENRFCRMFSTANVASVMRGYDEKYPELLVNIFKIVFTKALGCVLAGVDFHQLELTPSNMQQLQQKLECLVLQTCNCKTGSSLHSSDLLLELLEKAATKLCSELELTNSFFREYISLSLEDICKSLETALVNNCIEAVFVNKIAKTTKPLTHFMDNDKMEDELFRKLTAELSECSFTADKLIIIQRDIHSISDLVDVLESECLYEDEFTELFNMLGDNELAMLFNLLPINKIDCNFAFYTRQWHTKLNDYINTIGVSRKSNILELADKIELL